MHTTHNNNQCIIYGFCNCVTKVRQSLRLTQANTALTKTKRTGMKRKIKKQKKKKKKKECRSTTELVKKHGQTRCDKEMYAPYQNFLFLSFFFFFFFLLNVATNEAFGASSQREAKLVSTDAALDTCALRARGRAGGTGRKHKLGRIGQRRILCGGAGRRGRGRGRSGSGSGLGRSVKARQARHAKVSRL